MLLKKKSCGSIKIHIKLNENFHSAFATSYVIRGREMPLKGHLINIRARASCRLFIVFVLNQKQTCVVAQSFMAHMQYMWNIELSFLSFQTIRYHILLYWNVFNMVFVMWALWGTRSFLQRKFYHLSREEALEMTTHEMGKYLASVIVIYAQKKKTELENCL